jgi:hypothetical protein
MRTGAPHVNHQRPHHDDSDGPQHCLAQRFVAEESRDAGAKVFLNQVVARLHLEEQVTKPPA